MSGSTSKYTIPYPTAGDTVAGAPTTLQSLAQRVDLMLGESGLLTLSNAAATPVNSAIVLSRTYPGNATGVPGIVHVMTYQSLGATVFNWWIGAWTGTTSTITGFTITTQFSTLQSGRNLVWRFIPTLS